MFGKKQKVVTPIKTDIEARTVKFPDKPNNPQSATKIVPTGSDPRVNSLLFTLQSPRCRITPQFTYDLFLNEIDFETKEQPSQDVVAKLFELYKVGIEYYNAKQDQAKQLYFKKKLDNLTNHPKVLGLLHSQKHNEDNFYKRKQVERLVEINKGDAVDSVETMLKKLEKVETANEQTVRKGLDQQLQQIRKRREKRKIASKPVSVNGPQDTVETRDEDFSMEASQMKPHTSKKGSVSFALQDAKQNHDYDKYFVEGYTES